MTAEPQVFQPRQRAVIVVCCVLVLALVPLLLRYENTHGGWSTENSDRLMNMDGAARSRLEISLDRFDRLPEERQTAIRELHGEVQADPELAVTLADYALWLEGLELYQRFELREAEDRIELVRDYRADEMQAAESFELSADFVRMLERGSAQRMARVEDVLPLRIRYRELDAMLEPLTEALEAHPPEGTPSRDRDRGSPTESRGDRILSFLHVAGGGPGDQRIPAWFDESLCLAALNGIDDSEKRQALTALNLDDQRRIVKFILVRGLMRSGGRFGELDRYRPSTKELKDFYGEIDDAKVRGELLQLSPEWARKRLEWMHIAQNEEVPEPTRQLAAEAIDRAKSYSAYRGPGRGFPGRGGFDGRGRPGSGRGGGRPGRGDGRPDRGGDGRAEREGPAGPRGDGNGPRGSGPPRGLN